jgi:hypothetical protein
MRILEMSLEGVRADIGSICSWFVDAVSVETYEGQPNLFRLWEKAVSVIKVIDEYNPAYQSFYRRPILRERVSVTRRFEDQFDLISPRSACPRVQSNWVVVLVRC